MESSPQISVIVCTFNRASFLNDCICSILDQSLDRDLFEVIIVDNASTDDTAEILQGFREKLGVTIHYEPVAGLSRARNTGWKLAKGPYVAYLDDDARADKNWLRNALQAFNSLNPAPDVLTGPIRLFGEVTIPEWIDEELKGPLGYLDWGQVPLQVRYSDKKIVGANCFFTREVLDRLGGFSEALGRKKKLLLSGEEVLLQKRVEESGGSVWYHPGVSVQHYVPVERIQPRWYYRRYYWGGVSDYVMSKTYNDANTVDGQNYCEIQEPMALEGGRFAQVYRLAMNMLNSMGLTGSKSRTIRSRIYMCYVWGYVRSVFMFSFKL